MKNKGAYILFFAVVVALQILVLNHISVSVYAAPVVYAVLRVMMPLETSQFAMLRVGLALGLSMDATMGVEGLNTLATLPVAFFRRSILHLTADLSGLVKIEGVPSAERLGRFRFHRYTIVTMLLHETIFFSMEWLSFNNIGFFIARLLCSTAVSLAIAYLLIYIFTPKLSCKS